MDTFEAAAFVNLTNQLTAGYRNGDLPLDTRNALVYSAGISLARTSAQCTESADSARRAFVRQRANCVISAAEFACFEKELDKRVAERMETPRWLYSAR